MPFRPLRLVLRLPLVPCCAALAPGCADDAPAPARTATPAAAVAIVPRPGLPAGLAAIAALPRVEEPTAIAVVPDGSRRIFVARRDGRIAVVGAGGGGAAPIALDLRPVVPAGRPQDGLLGLAFHPAYARNRRAFVAYAAARPARLVLARYEADPADPDRLDPDTAAILLSIDLPFDTRRGGALAFDRDGLLLVGVGDGGGLRDPFAVARDPRRLLGKVLRLDVDAAGMLADYAIPPANPWRGNRDEWREEVLAPGFREPRQLAVDPVGGAIWVGEAAGGVIRLIPGRAPAPATAPAAPLAGLAVYRGAAWPALAGRLIGADGPSGRIWARPAAGGPARVLATHPAGLAALTLDPDREPLFLGRDGQVLALR